MNPRLSPSVSVVPLGVGVVEFFKTNTRQQVRLRTPDDTILRIVNGLDGTKDASEIATEHGATSQSVASLLSYLERNGILDNVQPSSDFDAYEVFRRPVSFLQDFSTSHEHLVRMWDALRSARVVVVGLGAVGSWVACCLVQTGVRRLVLVDPDVVELSNLHRQLGYRTSDVGRPKVDALSDALMRYRPDLDIERCPVELS